MEVRKKAGWLIIALIGLLVIAAPAQVFADVYGKVAGTVIDKKTKEPLIGCTVMIEGTTRGASTGVDGGFYILSVPAGRHNVIIKMLGYNPVQVVDLDVSPGLTATITVEMEIDVIDLQRTTIVHGRNRQPIQFDVASTRRTVTSEKIATMPVTNVADILRAQVGVVRDRDGQLHIRGGRANELIYIVDGVELKDPLGGLGPTESLNLSGQDIENLSILKGGWDAEYGNATSGVVNVATKSGDRRVTEGHFQFFTDDFGTDALNNSSVNYDRFEFNIGGPEQYLTGKLLPALGIEQLRGKLTYMLSGDIERADTYLSYNDFTSPSRKLRFRDSEVFGIRIADRQENTYNAGLKLTYRMTPDIRTTLLYKGSWERGNPYGGNQRRYGWQFRYTPNTVGWNEVVNTRLSMTFLHNVSRSTFYQIIASRYARGYTYMPGDENVPGGRRRPDSFLQWEDTEFYTDVNGNGVYDPPEPFVNVYPDTNRNGLDRYNFGDVYLDRNYNNRFDGVNSEAYDPNRADSLLFDFNGNGLYDAGSGEPFVDVNGNGRWDANDVVTKDANGNGIYDEDRRYEMNRDLPEPYIDGDISLGEPFTDINNNGVWDTWLPGFKFGEPYEDLSKNSKFDGPQNPWLPGVPYRDLNGNGMYDHANYMYDTGEPFTDQNGNGKWDPADGFWDYGYNQWSTYHNREVTVSTFSFDMTSQVMKEHEIKTGFKVAHNDLQMQELKYPHRAYEGPPDDGLWPDLGIFRDFYKRTPVTGSFYFRDKLEYGQMVANLGFRWDFFSQSNGLEEDQELSGRTEEIVQNRSKFSPRIAFSYPISDKAKVFFNYGHFYQLPELTFMYAQATQPRFGAANVFGNYNLDYKKTIQYEFGIQYAMSPEYVLSVQGFYKDDFGLINTKVEGTGLNEFSLYTNHDYARARGLELELEKKYGNYVSGYVTYNFAYAYGKSSSQMDNYYATFRGQMIPIQEYPLNWDVRHQVTLNLDLRVAPGDHPRLFGLKMPDNWGINILWQYGSGFPYTPSVSHPGTAESLMPGEDPLPNSERMPSNSVVDMRFNKSFSIWKLRYSFEIWVDNLFDTENIVSVYPGTGRPTTSLNIDGVAYQSSESHEWPSFYGPGRNIRLGLAVNF